jgi:16S rRNA (guanine527-N7)-methyltransferase
VAYDRALDAALEALGFKPASATRRAIDDHVRLMLAWNAAINLTAIADPADVARLHVADSLAAVPVLADHAVTAFVDIGSGAGFPGIPLAAALGSRTLLVESIAKKARFLETVIGAVGIGGVTVAATRAEALAADPGHRERWPAATARAVAALPELVELAFPLLGRGGILVAWKRGDLGDEIAAAERAGQALGGARIEVVDAAPEVLPGHLLVVVEKLRGTPSEYPRDPAARQRRPW